MLQRHKKMAKEFENLLYRHTIPFDDTAAGNCPGQAEEQRVLPEGRKQQDLMIRWIRCMARVDTLEELFDLFLRDLLDYFGAGSGFIRSFTAVETVRYISSAGHDVEIPFAQQPDSCMLSRWETLLGNDCLVLVRSVDGIAAEDPVSHGLLKARGIESLCLVPVYSNQRMVGIIGLGNLGQNLGQMDLLRILSYYIAVSIQKKLVLEEKVRVQYMDNLTGHPNFEGYKLRVDSLLRENTDKKYGLLYCDIKRFKFVNEVYGYDTGDRLLQYWSGYLSMHVREGEAFCRISGDTMSMLLQYGEPGELNCRFEEMAAYLSAFAELNTRRYRVELACGIYLVRREEALNLGEMLNRANMAQKKVKDYPGSRLSFFTGEMRQKEVSELNFTINMREALRKKEFLLYFQPQIAAKPCPDRALRAEVLVRWEMGGTLVAMPGEFIGLFERNGFIVDLDRYMFENACRYIRKTEETYQKQLCLSVNVSRITMMQPNFVEEYCRIKDKYRIADGLAELEFTENVAVQDVEYFTKLVERLRKRGFSCAMDDFGSGQSSLNVLQALPLDILKLDQMFFRDRRNEGRKRIIVASVLEMARKLDMMTVAEGIETAAQADELCAMGCDYIQGYYYSRPLAAVDFEDRYLKVPFKE